MTRPDSSQPDDHEYRGDRDLDVRLAGPVAESLARIAAAMPVDGDGVAAAALHEARAMRRRRTVGALAAASALVALAVPVSQRLAEPPAAPVAPAVSSTVSDTPPTTAEQTTTLNLTGPVSGRIVRPYVVDGTYHGASGVGRVVSGSGLSDVLNLSGGAKVLRLQPISGEPRVLVQASNGSVDLALPGVAGRAVADATGERWALLDAASGILTVRDTRGTVIAATESAGSTGPTTIRSVVGFSGGRVVVTTAAGTALWDPATRRLTAVSPDTALDASDTAARTVSSTDGPAGLTCWQVRSSTDPRQVFGSATCGAPGAVALSADGRHVVVRHATGATAAVYSARGGRPVLQVQAPAGVTIEASSFRVDPDELVLATRDRTGHRLVGCTLRGACEVLTPTSSTPYLLVRD